MVYKGELVSFIGRFITRNGGEDFYVTDAVPFTGDYRKIVNVAMKSIWKSCEDPRTWADPPYFDIMKIRDYKGFGPEVSDHTHAGDKGVPL